MKRLNKNMHGDAPAFYRLPEAQDLAAQYLLLYEFSLPFARDLNDRIDVSKSATRMTVTVKDATSRDLRELDKRAQVWLRAHAPTFAQEASGLSVIMAHVSQRNIDSMLSGTIIAMTLISFLLIWIFKSLRIGLLSLLPNFIPALMTFGLWGHIVGQIGMASSVVLAVTFGIIVDDTIHFLSKYLKARREESCRARGRTLRLSHRGSCVMDDDSGLVGGLSGVRRIGIRAHSGARFFGHDHDHLRAFDRFPASADSADRQSTGEILDAEPASKVRAIFGLADHVNLLTRRR